MIDVSLCQTILYIVSSISPPRSSLVFVAHFPEQRLVIKPNRGFQGDLFDSPQKFFSFTCLNFLLDEPARDSQFFPPQPSILAELRFVLLAHFSWVRGLPILV